MQILALDVGTSSVKAAVLDVAAAQPVGAVAHVPYELDAPTPDAAEVPPQRLWGAVSAAAREATRKTPAVEAVGLSCLTPALVLLDRDHQPLANVWTHLDRRARGAARQGWQAVGPEFLATAGNRPLPGGISAVSDSLQPDFAFSGPIKKNKAWFFASGRYIDRNDGISRTKCAKIDACLAQLTDVLTAWEIRSCVAVGAKCATMWFTRHSSPQVSLASTVSSAQPQVFTAPQNSGKKKQSPALLVGLRFMGGILMRNSWKFDSNGLGERTHPTNKAGD